MKYFRPVRVWEGDQRMQDRQNPRPRLVITLGDPAGIGPEVILKALADPRLFEMADLTIAGSKTILQQTYQQLQVQGRSIADPETIKQFDVDLEGLDLSQIQLGQGNATSGEVGFRCLTQAIAATIAGQFEGIVTAPIAKSAWSAAGHPYPGQTELLAEQAGVDQFGMAFVGRSPQTGWVLRTLLATTHIPLRQVPEALTPTLMTQKLELLLDCLHRDFCIDTPKIAIAGLNPHSGEQGQLGREEVEWMNEWLAEAQQTYPQAQLVGFVPPDTLWVKPGQAWFGTAHNPQSLQSLPDAFLALYHDQGLIPVKLMAFDRAVNTTIGLPFVRTSPDHGTAFDIAGRGIAEATSLREAIRWAAELAIARRQAST